MNGSAENKAHGASEKPSRREKTLDLETACKMLTLVQRIVEDIVTSHQELTRLVPEQDRLDRHKRDLSWPERQRRYRVQEQIAAHERMLEEAGAELAGLGVCLLDAPAGQVAFPTVVNNRKAFFSWIRGEDGVHFWHYPGETNRRPVPASWAKEAVSSSTDQAMVDKTSDSEL
jgi:hypothetical protein